MTPVGGRRLFALDQNFPTPVLNALSEAILEAELVHVENIASGLSELDDWQLLVALHLDSREWDGLITTDNSMPGRAREMAALHQTNLTLVVADAAGHDPVKATGLVLTYLPSIARDSDPKIGQLWNLRTRDRRPTRPWQAIESIADHTSDSPNAVFSDAKLTRAELTTYPTT